VCTEGNDRRANAGETCRASNCCGRRIEEEEAIEQSISDPPPPLLLLHRSKLIVLEEQLAMVFYTTVRVLSYLCLASTRGIDDARMSATEETCLVKANGKV
jgi:hypothetical protein